MRAMQVNNSGQGPALIEIDLPQPEPGEGELLISVRAVGVTLEDRSGKVDVVFDTAGGDTLDRSWAVLNASGRLVTIVSGLPDNAEQRVKDAFFIVEPSQKQLLEVATLLDSGTLKTYVNAVVPFEEASDAYSGAVRGKLGYGKVVIVLPGR